MSKHASNATSTVEEAPPSETPRAYRLITGPDDATFCDRVSEALASGYRLHGSPALTSNGGRVIAAQAVVLASVAEGSGA